MTFHYHSLFPLRKDKTLFRKLSAGACGSKRSDRAEFLLVEREAMRALSEAAMTDINHLLRPAHLAQLAKILDDPDASSNDKFVAFDLLKNANIAAGGILPMCQDTGTAIVMGKRAGSSSPMARTRRHRRGHQGRL